MRSDALDFSRRAYLSELMDEPCSYAEFRDCLRDLEQVNRVVFAYRATLGWLEGIARNGDGRLNIVDVGCGGGDMLRRIEGWAAARKLPVKLTGIDLNPHAARAAREFTSPGSSIEWVTGDIYSYQAETPVGVVISSQFTHHLGDAELVDFLRWMERVAERGWFINDLHRKIAPYYGFKALAWAMRCHRFIRHDGPVSIRRSFLREDWERYCSSAGMSGSAVNIEEVRPGRLCVSRVKR